MTIDSKTKITKISFNFTKEEEVAIEKVKEIADKIIQELRDKGFEVAIDRCELDGDAFWSQADEDLFFALREFYEL